jgi:hypothetical protein
MLMALNEAPAAVLRRVAVERADGDRLRLRATFETPSLLELGRYAQAAEDSFGDAVGVVGYRALGDLLGDGTTARIEHGLAGRTPPAWRGATSTERRRRGAALHRPAERGGASRKT